ncbi:MAG TPA: AAA domain-containing protein [Oligoflexia bacterium]|nr:AAA domain-containing protein [Oligoflexia bacterium]HMP49404.1 AAA domain-containing protein [Oligoflexia bacterium]
MKRKNNSFQRKNGTSETKFAKLPELGIKRLQYWIKSLEDGARIAATVNIDKQSTIEIPTEALFVKESPYSKSCKDFFLRHYESIGKQGLLPILICPIRIMPRGAFKGSQNVHNLLYIPALMTEDAELMSPQGDALPWIPREYIEPGSDSTGFSITSIETSELFFQKNYLPPRSDFSEYWRFAIRFFEHSTECRFSEFRIDGYENVALSSIVPFENNFRNVRSQIKVLEEVFSGRRKPGILFSFCKKAPNLPTDYDNSRYQYYQTAKNHLAHPSRVFPLSESQRQAIHRFIETNDGEVLCISGPPGTGKTTVLQSFITTSWVKAATLDQKTPPVMLVCGATNQSVMNVIDSFNGLASEEDNPLASRWLPEIDSYGTFLASAEKFESLSGYLMESRRGLGFSSRVESQDYLRSAKKYYLSRFSNIFGRCDDLSAAIKKIRSDLKKSTTDLSNALTTSLEISIMDIVMGRFRIHNKTSLHIASEASSAFDTKRRYLNFLLATHYWEGKWLIEIEKELHRRSLTKDLNLRFRNDTKDWQRRSMLTPVFVSTTSMACTFFINDYNRDTPPVDIIFFDEAGQIPTEQGMGGLTLAKKAVVIGDIEQLEPYSVIPPHMDILNLESSGLLSTKGTSGENKIDAFGELVASGITASSNNLMEFCLSYCRKDISETIGVFLSEHRRSVPEIISYCNRLSYQGRLKPERPPMRKRILPPFGFIHVSGPNFKIGSSRFNRDEAKAISAWINDNNKKICDFYNVDSIEKSLAILTPFTAQAREIRNQLKNKYPGLIIGTVNALQGAERNIILFSSVYDEQYRGAYILDRNKRILNVAVSRAKDSFILFGSKRLLSQEGKMNFPTQILGEYIMSTPGSRLN